MEEVRENKVEVVEVELDLGSKVEAEAVSEAGAAVDQDFRLEPRLGPVVAWVL